MTGKIITILGGYPDNSGNEGEVIMADSIIEIGKGEAYTLERTSESIYKLRFSFEKTEMNDYEDIDVSFFLLDKDGYVHYLDFVYYLNLCNPSKSVWIYGNSSEDECGIEFRKIPNYVEKIVTVLSFYDPQIVNYKMKTIFQVDIVENREFHSIKDNIYIPEKCKPLFKHTFEESILTENALLMAEIIRVGDEWRFEIIDKYIKGGLKAVCNLYGLDVE